MSDKFDASRYLVKLRGKEYLEVKWRLLWLRTEHPDAIVETEMVSHIINPPMAIFRARVSLPGGGSATGWKQEDAADFGDFLEKAETGALGRALAALGFGTQFADDFADAPDADRPVAAPAQRPNTLQVVKPPPPNQPPSRNAARPIDAKPETRPALPATEPQIKAIYAIGHGAHQMEDDEIDARSRELYGLTPRELSRRQASQLIDALKNGGK